MALAVAIVAFAAAAATARHVVVEAPPLPPEVAALVPGITPQGGGELKFLGLPIYGGWYWGDSHAWQSDRPYALDLHYHRRFTGTEIAQRSVAEMEKSGDTSGEERDRWGDAMRRIFPAVRKGDRLTGVHTSTGSVRYFLNGAAIGEIADRDFARAFFGIWLDPATSRPEFRKKLLGLSP